MQQIPSLVAALPHHYYDSEFKVGFMQFYLPIKVDENLSRRTKSKSILNFKEFSDRRTVDYYVEMFPKYLNAILNLQKNDKLVLLYPPSSHKLSESSGNRNNPTRLRQFLYKITPAIICDNVETIELFERVKSIATKSHNRLKHEESISVSTGKLNIKKLKSSKIVIFDDVITSGATMAACANLLEKAVDDKDLDIHFIALAGTTNSNLQNPNYQEIVYRKMQNPFGVPGEYL